MIKTIVVAGPLPDPKKPRTMHGTLIMKENVSLWLSHFYPHIGFLLL